MCACNAGQGVLSLIHSTLEPITKEKPPCTSGAPDVKRHHEPPAQQPCRRRAGGKEAVEGGGPGVSVGASWRRLQLRGFRETNVVRARGEGRSQQKRHTDMNRKLGAHKGFWDGQALDGEEGAERDVVEKT